MEIVPVVEVEGGGVAAATGVAAGISVELVAALMVFMM
jgi:hypothetical protein